MVITWLLESEKEGLSKMLNIHSGLIGKEHANKKKD